LLYFKAKIAFVQSALAMLHFCSLQKIWRGKMRKDTQRFSLLIRR